MGNEKGMSIAPFLWNDPVLASQLCLYIRTTSLGMNVHQALGRAQSHLRISTHVNAVGLVYSNMTRCETPSGVKAIVIFDRYELM